MTSNERFEKIYLLITAAQAQITNGNYLSAIHLIQDARIISMCSDEFLELNYSSVSDAMLIANRVIEAFQLKLQGKENAN